MFDSLDTGSNAIADSLGSVGMGGNDQIIFFGFFTQSSQFLNTIMTLTRLFPTASTSPCCTNSSSLRLLMAV